MPTASSSSTARSRAFCLERSSWDLNRLDDLVADAVHRVQTREWVLEDHRQVLASARTATRPPRASGGRAHEHDLARVRRRVAVDEPEGGEARDGLLDPDSLTMPNVSPRWTLNESPSMALTSRRAWGTGL